MMSAIESNVMVNPLNDKNIQVNSSDILKQISALKEFVLKSSEVNQAKINFLREEIANGRYCIISNQIAINMLADIELA